MSLILQIWWVNYRKGTKPYIPVGDCLLLWHPYRWVRWSDGLLCRAGIPATSLLDTETVLTKITTFCCSSESIMLARFSACTRQNSEVPMPIPFLTDLIYGYFFDAMSELIKSVWAVTKRLTLHEGRSKV